MKGKGWLSLLMLFNALVAGAQQPEELLTQWAQSSPIEKIYLHFDRDNYIAGETAWFKAYLYSDFLPDTISSTLYTELIHGSSGILVRKILPVISGTTHGQLELPDSLSSGYYQVRAYTATMLNHDTGFIYQRSFFIYGKKNKNKSNDLAENKIRLEFFPEGGNLVQGFVNTVAFKATDENGLPVSIKGIVKDDKNDTLASLNTYHDGMGVFELDPVQGKQYYAVLNDRQGPSFSLPASTARGIALSIIPHPQGEFFEIKQPKGDSVFHAAYMIGQMQHHVLFRQQFTGVREEMQGVINTQRLHSGILQVTVFNKEGYPLAERLCFVNNKEYIQPAELVADTVDFSPRARNHFKIQLKDTVQGSFSVSVTDPDRDDGGIREENIFSRLLLSSDIRGSVHAPAYYFRSDEDSVKTALDLLMMTNGWRRFRWTELLKNKQPAVRNRDAAFITLEGKALLRGSKKPFAEKQLLVLITLPDKKRITQLTITDKQGYFKIDSILFFGTGRLLFTDIRGKKSQYIDIKLSGDTLTRSFHLRPTDDVVQAGMKNWDTANVPGIAIDYDAIQKANGLMLEEVRVKVTKKSPLEELEDKYTNGIFSGMAEKSIDLVNSEEAMPYNNIFEYLQARVNGLQVFNDGLDYRVFYRQLPTVSALGNIPMTLYLDEIPTDASFISSIPGNQVALVKVYSSFIGASGNAPGGVLAIYTKKGADYVNTRGFASYGKYEGYSIIKEFYAPDYGVKKDENMKPDNRITLDWRPDILSNYINPSIPFGFYNNDRSRKFRVVVEGMTTSGKMVSLEKIITAKK